MNEDIFLHLHMGSGLSLNHVSFFFPLALAHRHERSIYHPPEDLDYLRLLTEVVTGNSECAGTYE